MSARDVRRGWGIGAFRANETFAPAGKGTARGSNGHVLGDNPAAGARRQLRDVGRSGARAAAGRQRPGAGGGGSAAKTPAGGAPRRGGSPGGSLAQGAVVP